MMSDALKRGLKRLLKAALAAAVAAAAAAALKWLADAPEGVPPLVLVALPPALLALEKWLQGQQA